jgi:hypothetical protein
MKKQKKQQPVKPAAVVPRGPLPKWAGPAILALGVILFYWIPLTSGSASIQWDAADMHYPLQKYFADRAVAGTIPFWTPYLFSGYPFLANPEVGAWFVPHWLFFLGGVTPRAIQMELALQAFLACLGMYLLLSRMAASRSAALLGSFAYGLSGFFAGHSSHVGIFSAAACFPWLLLAYRRAADATSPLRYTALGGAAGGLMILAGYVQTAMYGFLALGLCALADLWSRRGKPARQMRIVAIVFAMLAGALAVGAVQILPGLELSNHSIRSAAQYSQSTEGVLAARSLLTLIFPDALGAVNGNYTGPSDITQYYFYAGLLLLPLGAIGAVKSNLRLAAAAIIVPAAWYMLGPAAGFYRLGALIPGLHKVRAPIQGWFVVALGLALLAAGGADWIFARWRSPYVKVFLVAVLFCDVFYWNSLQNPLAYARSSFQELYGSREEVAREHVAAVQPPLSRFDAPRRLTVLGPLEHPLDLKLESTYGYFALEPAAYDDYTSAMERNPKLRDGLNVGRVLNLARGSVDANPSVLPRAYFPKSIADVSTAAESQQALEKLDPAAQSIVLLPHAPVQQDPAAEVSVVAHDEQGYLVRYRAATPSLLKLSVAWYPGWHAVAGGRELPILRVDHALMGVVVPTGSGEVDFHFRSDYFAAGVAVSLMAAIGLGIAAYLGVS